MDPLFTLNLPSTTTVTSFPVILTVIATTQTASLQYQWYKNNKILIGSSSNTISISSGISGDYYYCAAENADGNTTNSVATKLLLSENPIVITYAPVMPTILRGETTSVNKYFQAFTVSGVNSYTVFYDSSLTSPNAPPITVSTSGVIMSAGVANTLGEFSYYCYVSGDGFQYLVTLVLNVVSDATFSTYFLSSFTFTENYPSSSSDQGGLWNATVTAVYSKNQDAIIYWLFQDSGSVLNTVVADIPLDTTGLTVTYNGVTYTQSDVPCVLGFSEIKMGNGSVKAIRDIRAGDEVVSALTHKLVKVKEIRSRKVDYRSLNEENHIRVIPNGFFGDNSPSRDLYISGLHCVMLKIADTVNSPRNRLSFQSRRLSSTFKLPTPEEIKALTGEEDVVYYHIDLDGLDAVYCEDVPIESYYREN